jgi:hypothetical protein
MPQLLAADKRGKYSLQQEIVTSRFLYENRMNVDSQRQTRESAVQANKLYWLSDMQTENKYCRLNRSLV